MTDGCAANTTTNNGVTCSNCRCVFNHDQGGPFSPHPTSALDYVHGFVGKWWCNWCQVDRCEEYAREVTEHAQRRRAALANRPGRFEGTA